MQNRETNSPEINQRYTEMYNEFIEIIDTHHPDIAESMDLQRTFRTTTLKTALIIRNLKEKNDGQVAKLKELVQNGTESDLTSLNHGMGIPMPADPDITLIGVEKTKVNVYTSATKPLMLPMYIREKGKEEQEPKPVYIMFKTGDDMRQDALVLQV